ncbi:unnamed protein product [Dibothriocephalus latus]|uniref:Integrator complex subunit 7 N-terminal domain-containing protein n=1 Tax=Dibothriocephalus latus TaxID=60516 RepID=A0A3P7LJ46_DIBLA|nr:unnamed protein product [Dibothriocephalus latus]
MELNKGLSSTNLGEQCKAIAEFPTLILKYPFPMVINSIFLKISELFREGSFAIQLCPVICGLLQNPTTETDTKFKLISLCRYAYHDVVSLPKRLCKLFGSSSCISEKEEIFVIFFKLTESCNFVDLLLHPDETSTVPRALSLACKLAVLIHLRGGDTKLTSGRNSIFQSDSVSDFIAQTMSSRKAVKEEDQDAQDSEPWFLSTTGPPLTELKVRCFISGPEAYLRSFGFTY